MIETPLLRELGIGAGASAATGAAVWCAGRRRGHEGAAAFGRQTVAWAGVNGLLALGGWAAGRRRERGRSGETWSTGTPAAGTSTAGGIVVDAGTAARARTLRRVLLINAGLDVGYVVGGAALARSGRRTGDGVAIVVQGAFLLWLDTRHARGMGAVAAESRG